DGEQSVDDGRGLRLGHELAAVSHEVEAALPHPAVLDLVRPVGPLTGQLAGERPLLLGAGLRGLALARAVPARGQRVRRLPGELLGEGLTQARRAEPADAVALAAEVGVDRRALADGAGGFVGVGVG